MNIKKLFTQSKAFTLIELMVVVAIFAILMAIAIPNYIAMRHKGYCSEAESDAKNVAAAIANYFGQGGHTKTPSRDDLKISVKNDVQIEGDDPNELITIKVTDRTGRCPSGYQNANPRWDSNVYTLTIQ